MAGFSKKRSLLVLVLPICFSCIWSCSMFLLKAGGYLRNPKLEDRNSIKEYSKKKGDPYDLLWVSGSTQGFDTLLVRYPRLPSVAIFDRDMSMVENAQGEACHKMIMDFLKDTMSNAHIKTKTDSWQIFEKYCTQADIKSETQGYTHTIVYSWAIYTPRLTKRIFERMRELRDSTQLNLRFISLNRDYQKGLHQEVPKLKAGDSH